MLILSSNSLVYQDEKLSMIHKWLCRRTLNICISPVFDGRDRFKQLRTLNAEQRRPKHPNEKRDDVWHARPMLKSQTQPVGTANRNSSRTVRQTKRLQINRTIHSLLTGRPKRLPFDSVWEQTAEKILGKTKWNWIVLLQVLTINRCCFILFCSGLTSETVTCCYQCETKMTIS